MTVDYLIIGQGITGTWLSYFLQKEEKSFLVIDNHLKDAPSRIAAGIINPVTGRRHVTVWMAEELLPFVWETYTQLGNHLGIQAISQKNVIDFFPNPQMRVSFFQRIAEKGDYVYDFPEQEQFNNFFHYEFGCGEIKPVYTAHLETILPAWRQKLLSEGSLLDDEFDNSLLEVLPDKIHYKDITAKKIIYCDGTASNNNSYFQRLPFAPNKGEVFLVDIPDLPRQHIYKKGLMLVPMVTANQWWIGSNYAWSFENAFPTTEFREKTEMLLKEWLKIPFQITDHLCGIRPATLERRPFVGFHPQYPSIGILNGMGTKGCSLAPYFAQKMVAQLLHQQPIPTEASITRFEKILSRPKL